jgi:uncharacterized protein (DUF58 family)
VIPTPRLTWLFALGVPLLLLGILQPVWLSLVLLMDLVLAFAAVWDGLAATPARDIDVKRSVPERWVQGRPERVRFTVTNRGDRPARLLLRGFPPAAFAAENCRMKALIPPGRSRELAYLATPLERGTHRFGQITLRSLGRMNLVARQSVIATDEAVRVYPDLITVSSQEAILGAEVSRQLGRRQDRLRGEGREFHQLRDYTEGDDIRSLDWKKYAHRGKLTVREYRAERNQRILLLVDGGRMMTARIGGRLRFDWAIQAAGRLARSAHSIGDQVGITVFSRSIKATLPPARTRGQLRRISDILCEVEPDLSEPNLGTALNHTLKRTPRRTLVVLFTELSDPRAAETVLSCFGSLSRRHLGLVVTLADTDLEKERDRPVREIDDVYRRVAADELRTEFRTTGKALRSRGVQVVSARADALAGKTVQRYLEIKQKGLL